MEGPLEVLFETLRHGYTSFFLLMNHYAMENQNATPLQPCRQQRPLSRSAYVSMAAILGVARRGCGCCRSQLNSYPETRSVWNSVVQVYSSLWYL